MQKHVKNTQQRIIISMLGFGFKNTQGIISMLGLGLGLSVRVRIGVLYALNACKKDIIEIKTNPQK